MTKRKPPSGKKPKKNSKKTGVQLSDKSRKLVETGQKYYTKNYKPREMILDYGKGARLYDLDGREYVDFGAGIAVTALGHASPRLNKVLDKQAKKLWHTSNVFFNEPAVLLAEELCKASRFAKRVFFCSSGGEANEAAIKLARKYAANKGKKPSERKIITFEGSFHGRTLTTVTATAQPKYQEGFEPLPEGFVYCPYNDISAFSKLMDDDVCAVMLEMVQGEGGVRPVDPDFLKHVQALCKHHDALLILDQVQDGMGRTGKLFSHFNVPGVKPDIVTLAKGLGGGIPIGAMLAGAKVADVFQFGHHGSTFGGSPIATAVAREVLKALQTKTLMKNVRLRHRQIVQGLEKINKTYGIFSEIRGKGLMIGAELKGPLKGKAAAISEHARYHRLLVLVAGPNVVRFVPPLIINSRDVQSGLKRFEYAIQSFLLVEKK